MEKIREFCHPNFYDKFECPICKTSKDAPVVLVGIPGTEDGNIMEAAQVHSSCYQLWLRMRDIDFEVVECK